METTLSTAFAAIMLASLTSPGHAAQEPYTTARAKFLAQGLKPAAIPRGKNSSCGLSGEKAVCAKYPEAVDCAGMGANAGTCRMAFVATDGRFWVAAAYTWEKPNSMVLTGATWANAEDTKHLRNIIAGKAEFAD